MLYFDHLFVSCVIIFISLFTPVKSIDFCNDVCDGKPEHIFCKYPKEGSGPKCEFYRNLSLTEQEKISLLDKLNERRNRVAAGMVSYMPAASNMRTLVWNDDLAAMAQRWADQCVNHQNPDKSDSCRDLENMKVGQNIATVLGDTPGLTNTALVEMWYMESFNYNRSLLRNYQPSCDVGRRHFDYFTQLIWAKTSMVGCGRATFSENYENKRKKQTVHRLVCNFAPSGNILGGQVYSVGDPCSTCPDSTECDTVHKGLCKTSLVHKKIISQIFQGELISQLKVNGCYLGLGIKAPRKFDLATENYSYEETTRVIKSNEMVLSSSSNTLGKDSEYETYSTNSIYNNSISTIDVKAEESPYEFIDLIYSRKPLLEDPKRAKILNNLGSNINIDELVEILKERLKQDSSFLQSLAVNRYTNISFIQSSVAETLEQFMQRSSNDSRVNDILNLVYTAYPTSTIIYKTPDYDDTNSTMLNEIADLMGVREGNVTDEVVDYETVESDESTDGGPSFGEKVDRMIVGADYGESSTIGAAGDESDTILSGDYVPFTTTKSFLDAILDEDDDNITTTVYVFSPVVDFKSRGQKTMKKWLKNIKNNQTNNVPFNF